MPLHQDVGKRQGSNTNKGVLPSQEHPRLEVISFATAFQVHVEFYLNQEKAICQELKAWGFTTSYEVKKSKGNYACEELEGTNWSILAEPKALDDCLSQLERAFKASFSLVNETTDFFKSATSDGQSTLVRKPRGFKKAIF
ncbi:hypothetical protein CJ030_MR6G029211 [Morella rubra]|uniref:Uncharacterized protein n=1 Tax=Morella rubra TaxID=262757 RepID=A0A6A1VCR9_9ROSI|nr:hypothetical protein CJ030_MR6G029211 [Morella rubra]